MIDMSQTKRAVHAIYEVLKDADERLSNYRPLDLEYKDGPPDIWILRFEDHEQHEFYVEAEEFGNTFLTRLYVKDETRDPEYTLGSVKDIPIEEEKK